MRRRLISVAIALLTLCLICSQALPQEQHNFLWKVESETSTVYLLGSLHLFKKEFYPLNKAIEDAFEKSNILVVEANITDPSPKNLQKWMEAALYSENDSVEKHVSKETFEFVRKEANRLGVPLDLIKRQRPWLLAITLEALSFIKLGFDPRYGIDAYFLTKAAGKKKISELEGVDDQFALLSGLSNDDQELLLLLTLRDSSRLNEQMDQLVKAWTTGDAKSMESLVTKSLKEDPRMSSIFEKLFDRRNGEMASKIEKYLKTKETHFVVVGAGHLVGDKGIVEILKEKGYSIEQL